MTPERSYFEALPRTVIPPDYIPFSPTPKPHIEKPEGERKKWVGYIGTEPKIKQLKDESYVVQFALAEHNGDGETIWHRVYATKKFADRVRRQPIEKGVFVEVAGRPQLRVETNNGESKEVAYVYAYGLRVLGGKTE